MISPFRHEIGRSRIYSQEQSPRVFEVWIELEDGSQYPYRGNYSKPVSKPYRDRWLKNEQEGYDGLNPRKLNSKPKRIFILEVWLEVVEVREI